MTHKKIFFKINWAKSLGQSLSLAVQSLFLTAEFSEKENGPFLCFSSVEPASLKHYVGLILEWGSCKLCQGSMSLITVVWKGNNCSFSTVVSQAWKDCNFPLCSFSWTRNICHKTVVWCGSKGFSWSKSPAAATGKEIRQVQPICRYCTRLPWLINFFNDNKHCSIGNNNHGSVYIIYTYLFIYI